MQTAPEKRSHFQTHATPLRVVINGMEIVANPKEFSTGSYGWHCGGKMNVFIGGQAVQVQIGLNLTVIGSKER